MNVLLFVFWSTAGESSILLEQFVSNAELNDSDESGSLYKALTHAGKRPFIGPDNVEYMGDLWLENREEGFSEAFSMSSTARAEYKRLAETMRESALNRPQLARQMIQLIKNVKVNPGAEKYIQTREKRTSLAAVFGKKTMKDQIIAMVPAAQAFLNALHALGGGSWGLLQPCRDGKHGRTDISRCINIFVAQIFSDMKFPKPYLPVKLSYMYDLQTLYIWMDSLISNSWNPCNSVKPFIAPKLWCVFSEERLGELSEELLLFKSYLKSLGKPPTLTPMSEATYKHLSAILARMKAKTKKVDFKKYLLKFKKSNPINDWEASWEHPEEGEVQRYDIRTLE